MPRPSHVFAQLDDIVSGIRPESCSWDNVEAPLLGALSAFDTEYAEGHRDRGWYQCKARYFNDVVVRLIEAMSGRRLATRIKVKSELFGKLDADFCYPGDKDPLVAGEVKALGTPPHPDNKNQARAGCSDLHQRIREVALTSLDFKVAHSTPSPIRSFQSWVDRTDPGYFAFWAVRIKDNRDLSKVREMLTGLRVYCNGVGAILYRQLSASDPTSYEVVPVQELKMDKVLREVAQRIRSAG